MRLSKQKVMATITMALLLTTQVLTAQTKGIAIDRTSSLPISFVNIYTTNNSNVLGTTSNAQGEFLITFPFDKLVFSHINYEKVEIKKSDCIDTVYMNPTERLLNEIVVSNQKPQWIDRVLKEIIKQKKKNYQTNTKDFTYCYATYTVNDSSGYAFNSSGNMRICPFAEKKQYWIEAEKNVIRYKDKTAGVNFADLRRILYENFIDDFDGKFIKTHQFQQNHAFENDNQNLVQLIFSSTKYQDDNGYIVVDTLNKVITEVERNSGTEFNTKTKTASILRNFAASYGYRYDVWITKAHAKYLKIGQCYYMTECKYKFYMKQSCKHKDYFREWFASTESQLFLNKETQITTDSLLFVPKLNYITTFYTKQMQKEDEALHSVPVIFENF